MGRNIRDEAQARLDDEKREHVILAIKHHLSCIDHYQNEISKTYDRIVALEQGAAPNRNDIGRGERWE